MVTVTGFRTAAEFHGTTEPTEHDRDPDAPNYAKTIVWYDPATPLYVCEGCHEHVAPLQGAGERRVVHVEAVRSAAYRHLMTHDPACDACAGDLAAKVDP